MEIHQIVKNFNYSTGEKTNKASCAHSEDSYQVGRPSSLITVKVIAVRFLKYGTGPMYRVSQKV